MLTHNLCDANFEDFINKGFLPEAIINYISLLGWSPKDNTEKMSMEELIEKFDVSGLSKSGSIFDEAKMRWLNQLYVKELPFEKFMEYARPYFDKSCAKGKYDYDKLGRILMSRVEIFSEIPDKVAFLDEYGSFDTALFVHQKSKTTIELAREILEKILPLYEGVDEWTNENLFKVSEEFAAANGYKKQQLFWAVRVAVAGRDVTPGGATELMDILGKNESLRRINYALTLF